MKLPIETHSHTLASDHAYSTVRENAQVAAERGLALLCITDHGPAMGDSPDLMHFVNYRVLDREMFGVSMRYGVELNIIDYKGSVDLDEKQLALQDICIAGFHPIVTTPGSRAENTRAMLGAMQNPHVSAIAHPEDGNVPIDFEAFVKEAIRCSVLVEVNNNSLKNADYRLNVRENLIELLKICERLGAMVSIGSDAHYCSAVGDFTLAAGLLEQLDFPPELIINTDPDRYVKHLESKR